MYHTFVMGAVKTFTEQVIIRTTGQTGPEFLNRGGDETTVVYFDAI